MEKNVRLATDSVDIEKEIYQNAQSVSRQRNKIQRENNTITKSFKYIHLVPFLLLVCTLLYVAKNGVTSSTSQGVSSLEAFSSAAIPSENALKILDFTSSKMEMYATNEYGHFEGAYPFFAEYPGSQLVEPFKATTLLLRDGLASEIRNGKFIWEIESLDSAKQLVGREIKITITSIDKPVLNVKIHIFSDNKYIATVKTYLIVKYVKRDIRSLTTKDRETFLSAARTIWEYTTAEGQAKFGSKFTGIHTFVREHAKASEDIMCDGYHEGSGFLTHHLALSNSFEAAIRAVDPSVTLPYWDFSKEGQLIADLGKTPSYLQKISPVFTKDWFGEVDKFNHIKNSRWAHSLMPLKDESDDTSTSSTDSADGTTAMYPTNSYGYYRSYWNNNPDPEVTRSLFNVCGLEDIYKPIATCQIHYNVLNLTTLADFQTLSPTDGHGPLHVQIGGVYGSCSEAYTAFTTKWKEYLQEDLTEEFITSSGQNYNAFINKWGSTAQRQLMLEKTIMSEYYRIYRGLWRSHMCAVDASSALLECPTSCSVATDSFKDCSCSVPKLASGATTWENLFPCVVFSSENRDTFNKTMSAEFMADLTSMIASNSLLEGEMMHSGSPADIMFWMIHPVIERLLAAKRLTTVTKMGGVDFYKWDVEAMDGSSDNWLSYSAYNLEAGENAFHPEAYTCPGHAADDAVLPTALPFTSIITSTADRDSNGVISNWEFYLALDPNSVHKNDYVFDHFEWDHCTAGTIDTSAVSNSKLKTTSKSTTTTTTTTRALGASKGYTSTADSTPAVTATSKTAVSLNANTSYTITAAATANISVAAYEVNSTSITVIVVFFAAAILALIWSQRDLGTSSDDKRNAVAAMDKEVLYDSEVQPLLSSQSSSTGFIPHTKM